MIAAYRPLHEQSKGEENVRNIEATASPVPEPVWEPSPISHRETDATNPAFWRALIQSAPERKVSRQTAEFAIRTLLVQTAGYKGHRAQIDFDHDPVTQEALFGKLEKLCGGAAGWQLAQKLGGY